MPPTNIIWHCVARIPLSSSPQNSTIPPPSDNWHCSRYLEHIPGASDRFWDMFMNVLPWILLVLGILTVIVLFIVIIVIIFICIQERKEDQE
ncbi:hypothetical protein BofuT4_uP035370.1 [Botrytis cinerea T4]|uniref:Uncharacterized protein n=1 Tax=Botryotinia fuckeliana (strain T4) TaxID=999810 RepID=G2Y6J2_BOTF4|nr:hypothetical protein BofuT4_uP035370.1 [Botrytis cinerea T4]